MADEKKDTKASEAPPKRSSNGTGVSFAQRAGALIFLQIGSRALTFIVNQTLLRHLSPELLGISTQLELYAISVLYFARESLRVALTRQASIEEAPVPHDGTNGVKIKKVAESYGPAKQAQQVVNLSYIAIFLGPILAYFLGTLYLRKADPRVLSTPYIHEALQIYGLATILELLIEPCFVVAVQRGMIGPRARAESTATVSRCLVTWLSAVYGARNGLSLGVLPFALGQLTWALALNLVYYASVWSIATHDEFSLLPRKITSSFTPSPYYFSYFHKPTLVLARSLYTQSGLKHILTQGDAFMIGILASLSTQGIYALASNYGSLLARMLFQPLEESSRGLFARLLTSDSSCNTISKDRVQHAQRHLTSILRFYAIMTLPLATLLPNLAPILLHFVAGPQWASTSAPAVLSLYAYYLPLLAFNGVLEAFVAATATPAQLQTQSFAMFGFSAGFAAAGYYLLKVLDLGASGLVLANIFNMGLRILWSWSYVRSWLKEHGTELSVRAIVPGILSIASSVLFGLYLGRVSATFEGRYLDLIKGGAISGISGLLLLFLERDWAIQTYKTFTSDLPSSTPTQISPEDIDHEDKKNE